MMAEVPLIEKIDFLSKKVDFVIDQQQASRKVELLPPAPMPPIEFKRWKLPSKFKMGAKKKIKQGKTLVLMLGANKRAELDWGLIDKGMIYFGDKCYGYEPEAVYTYENKFPFVAVFEWRLFPVGGAVEEYRSRNVGGVGDIQTAEGLKIYATGQQIVKRQIELAKIAKLEDGKKGSPNMMMWILFAVVGIVVVYVLLKMFGKA